MHLSDPALEPCCQGLIGEGRADDGGDDLVQIGQTLDRIGEGLLVDLGVFGADAVADGAVGDSGKVENFMADLPRLLTRIDRRTS